MHNDMIVVLGHDSEHQIVDLQSNRLYHRLPSVKINEHLATFCVPWYIHSLNVFILHTTVRILGNVHMQDGVGNCIYTTKYLAYHR